MIPQHLQPKRKTSRSFSFSFSSLFRSWYGLIGFLLIVFLFLLPIIRLVWLSISSEDGISLAMYRGSFIRFCNMEDCTKHSNHYGWEHDDRSCHWGSICLDHGLCQY